MKHSAASTTGQARSYSGNVRNRAAHAAIIAAAVEVLNEVGYGGFTIEMVARRSGSGKPTIYRWWKNKSELFMEIYNRESALLLPVEDLGSVREELIHQITYIFEFWRETVCGRAFRGLIAESQADPVSLTQLRDQFMPQRRNLARVILERGRARGEFRHDADLDPALDILYGFTLYRLLTDQLDDVEEPTAAVVDMMLCGLGVPREKLGKAAEGKSAPAGSHDLQSSETETDGKT